MNVKGKKCGYTKGESFTVRTPYVFNDGKLWTSTRRKTYNELWGGGGGGLENRGGGGRLLHSGIKSIAPKVPLAKASI